MPIVSILLPTYKNPAYILRAIDSVIKQSYEDWELLIIDDGLTETAKGIISDFIKQDQRIVVISNLKNLGIQKSLNHGLSKARGVYVARIDDDDEWTDIYKLHNQVDFLKNNPEYVLVGTGALVVNGKKEELFRYFFPETDISIRNKILYKNCFIHSSVVFSKEKAVEVGGYSESIDVLHIEDYDLWFKLGLQGKMYNLQKHSVSFTVHENSISSKNKKDQLLRNIQLIKKYKNKYPNFTISIVNGILKARLYDIYCVLPVFLRNTIFRFYKKML